MEAVPNTKQDMIDLVSRAMDEAPVPPDARQPIDDEAMALLADGQLDALPPEQQERILAQVAAQPEAAELLSDLRALGLSQLTEKVNRVAITPELRYRAAADERRDILFRFSKIVWSVAAALVLTLGIWRAAVPTEPHQPRPRGAPVTTTHEIRDRALTMSACILVLISFPAVLLRRRKP